MARANVDVGVATSRAGGEVGEFFEGVRREGGKAGEGQGIRRRKEETRLR